MALAWCATVNRLGLPGWLPLVTVALVTAFSTLLSGGHWPRFVLASVVGTFSVLCGNLARWPISHRIVATYARGIAGELAVVALVTLVVATVSLSAGFAVRRLSVSNPRLRRAIWISFSGTLMVPLIALALTPTLVAQRIARNNRLASVRFEALNRAVEETRSETGNTDRICDGTFLKSHYAGPSFSESEWHLITGSYVIEDDYLFGIRCPDETGTFTIVARPVRDSGDGTHEFCTDETGVVGCRLEWSDSRNKRCLPCT